MYTFLTGGTGFIGHFVAKELLEKGHKLKILARNPNKIPSLASHKDVEMIFAGLLDETQIKKGMEGCDNCVHVALGWGETPLTMLANDTTVTALLLETAANTGVKKFIYTSSTAAFGKMRANANEEMACKPQDLYGSTKASGEAYTLGFTKSNMIRNIIRPGYTFGHLAFPDGVDQPDRRFFNIAKAVKENQTINLIKRDGTQFIHASQLAKLYSALLESDINEEVFFGLGSTWTSWKSVAERAIALHSGTKAEIVEEDKGWSAEPHLFSLEKIHKHFNLKFDATPFLDEHLKWNLGKVI